MQHCVNDPPIHPISCHHPPHAPLPNPLPSSSDLTLVFPGLGGFCANKKMQKKKKKRMDDSSPASIKAQPTLHCDISFTFSHRYCADPPDLLPSYLMRRAYMCIRRVIIGFPHASVAVTACLTVHEIMAESLRAKTDWLRCRLALIFVAITIVIVTLIIYGCHKGKRSCTFSDKGKKKKKKILVAVFENFSCTAFFYVV